MEITHYLSKQKDISVELAEKSIIAGGELHGIVFLNYPGRFDSVVINSQIENSSDVFSYVNINGKKINHPYARISIFKTDLGANNTIQFTAITKHIPVGDHSNVKFRVTIIQEHKEVASDVTFLRITKGS